MVDAGERAYAYTRACGIIGKSFIGKRVSALAALRTLSELDRLVFPGHRPELPGPELLANMENRFVKRAVDSICSIIRSYHKPPKALICQLQSYEYADLKTCLHYLADGKKTTPLLSGIGEFGTVKFEKYPDINLMLEGTEFEFLLAKIPENFVNFHDADLTALETELDLRYYVLLIESLSELPPDDRNIASMILAREISLRNCVWAFRLRSYFRKSEDDTEKYLMDIAMREYAAENERAMYLHKERENTGKKLSLAKDAFASLDKALDRRSDWKGWRWEKLLNPEQPDGAWEADPRYFQNSASYYLYRLALSYFRTSPFSVSAIFCFIKIKQFEEDLLTSISEGLALGLSPADVLSLLEVRL